MESNWTRSRTISPPEVITINYVLESADGGEEKKSVSLTSTSISETTTNYTTVTYEDGEGKIHQTDVATSKIENKRTTQAAVAESFVAARLSFGLGLPGGSIFTRSETIYQYYITTDGPQLGRELSVEAISDVQFAGGLPIPTEAYRTFTPSTTLFIAQQTEILYDSITGFDGRTITQQTTNRWMSFGLSQEGQAAFAAWVNALEEIGEADSNTIRVALEDFKSHRFEGSEVQVNVGRAPAPEKPSDQEIAAAEVINGGNNGIDPDPNYWRAYDVDSGGSGTPDWSVFVPGNWQDFDQDSDGDGVPDWAPFVPDDSSYTSDGNNSFDRFITGTVRFQGENYIDPEESVAAVYNMPFAPDDFFYIVNGSRRIKRTRVGARAAAERFGEVESALDIGHAFGQNIVSEWTSIPTLDLAPIYVQLAGIEAAFLTDSVSYAWDGNGMVVSSDLMLVGVTGWYGDTRPAGSWVRLPVPTLALNKITGPEQNQLMAKANTIAPPEDFDPRDTSGIFALLPNNETVDTWDVFRDDVHLIGPTLKLERNVVASGGFVRSREVPYALVLPAENLAVFSGSYVADVDELYLVTTGSIAELLEVNITEQAPWVPLSSIVYTQSSLLSNNDPATVESMIDGSIAGDATGTDFDSLAWVQADFGAVYTVNRVVVGTATTAMAGGWDKSYTENRNLQYSVDGVSWTTFANTGTLETEDIYVISAFITARYIRISIANEYVAITEFYALAEGQPLGLPEEPTILTGGFAEGIESELIIVPAATASDQAFPPTIEISGPSVAIPAAGVTTQALPPEILTATVVEIPAAAVTVSALAPEVVIPEPVVVEVPAVAVSVEALAPSIAIAEPVVIDVPAAAVNMAALAPEVTVGALGDPDFASVSLLLPFDGANGSTTFTDVSSNAFAVTAPQGAPVISTAVFKFGGSAGDFTSGGRLQTPANAAFNFNDNFTVELDIYRTGMSGSFDTVLVASVGESAFMIRGSTNNPGVFMASDSTPIAPGLSFDLNTWNHIAVVRVGSTVTVYKNGVSIGTGIRSGTINTSGFFVGDSSLSFSRYFRGYLDNLRITKGVARYTANFTPPTEPFPTF